MYIQNSECSLSLVMLYSKKPELYCTDALNYRYSLRSERFRIRRCSPLVIIGRAKRKSQLNFDQFHYAT